MTGRAISGVELIGSLPAEEQDILDAAMNDVTVPPGVSLAQAGDMGWAMYTIVEGAVDIVAPDGALIGTLGPGDVFGEVALLRSGRRVADVVSYTPLTLRALYTRDFLRIRAHVPVFEIRLRELIDARLEQTA